jgi:hypothetical protein
MNQNYHTGNRDPVVDLFDGIDIFANKHWFRKNKFMALAEWQDEVLL